MKRKKRKWSYIGQRINEALIAKCLYFQTMAPSLDSRQSPQVYVGPNPMQLAGALRKQLSSTAILDRGETGSLPGITQVDTPILDRVSHFL